MKGTVKAVLRNPKHTFSKQAASVIRLLAGLGVEGDAHMGVRVQHRSEIRLHLELEMVEITPCAQLDKFQPDLMSTVLDGDTQGNLICKAEIIGVVLRSGEVCPADSARVELPPEAHRQLELV